MADDKTPFINNTLKHKVRKKEIKLVGFLVLTKGGLAIFQTQLLNVSRIIHMFMISTFNKINYMIVLSSLYREIYITHNIKSFFCQL